MPMTIIVAPHRSLVHFAVIGRGRHATSQPAFNGTKMASQADGRSLRRAVRPSAPRAAPATTEKANPEERQQAMQS
jgi:hypothetical protein